jgi:hypothetical protein
MTELSQAFDTLLAEHDRVGSPLRRYLRSGHPQVDVQAMLASAGLAIQPELVEWFGLHDGADQVAHDRSRGGRVGLLSLLPADETYSIGGALGARDKALELASSSRFEPRWRPEWLPLIVHGDDFLAFDTRADQAQRVWRLSWDVDEWEALTRPICTSLASWLRAGNLRFRAGAYAGTRSTADSSGSTGRRRPSGPAAHLKARHHRGRMQSGSPP